MTLAMFTATQYAASSSFRLYVVSISTASMTFVVRAVHVVTMMNMMDEYQTEILEVDLRGHKSLRLMNVRARYIPGNPDSLSVTESK
jgi:hypothetical protein